MWIALIAVLVYGALKAGQLAFLGSTSGYRAEPESLGRRLQRGEPALLLVASVSVVPPALAQVWYHKHKFETVLRESAECYALLQVYRQVPEIKGSGSDHAIYEAIYGYRATALDAAEQLGFDARATQQKLARTVAATITERRRAAKRVVRTRLVAVRNCLHA